MHSIADVDIDLNILILQLKMLFYLKRPYLPTDYTHLTIKKAPPYLRKCFFISSSGRAIRL